MPSLAAHIGYDTVETLHRSVASTVEAYQLCGAVEQGGLCCTAVT